MYIRVVICIFCCCLSPVLFGQFGGLSSIKSSKLFKGKNPTHHGLKGPVKSVKLMPEEASTDYHMYDDYYAEYNEDGNETLKLVGEDYFKARSDYRRESTYDVDGKLISVWLLDEGEVKQYTYSDKGYLDKVTYQPGRNSPITSTSLYSYTWKQDTLEVVCDQSFVSAGTYDVNEPLYHFLFDDEGQILMAKTQELMERFVYDSLGNRIFYEKMGNCLSTGECTVVRIYTLNDLQSQTVVNVVVVDKPNEEKYVSSLESRYNYEDQWTCDISNLGYHLDSVVFNDDVEIAPTLPVSSKECGFTYEYTYDSFGNWTTKKQWSGQTLYSSFSREIEYY